MTFSYFSCFFSLFSIFFFCLLLYKAIFRWCRSFFRFFFICKESTFQYYKNSSSNNSFYQKTVVKISRIFNSKSPPWNLVKFRIELGKCLKNSVRNLYLHIYSICLWLDVSSLTEIQHLQWRQVEREHIPIKIWHLKCFICKDSSDDQSAFDGLKFFEFAVEWIPAIKNKIEIIFSSKNYFYDCIADKKKGSIFYVSGVLCSPPQSGVQIK